VDQDRRRDAIARQLAERYQRLERSRRTGPLIVVGQRFMEADGLNQGALLAIELFTTIIPLIIIGFAYFTGFAKTASVGNMFIRTLGIEHPLDDRVRAAFGTSSGIRSTWSIVGVAGFLIWGIPMSITVASMFARAWRRTIYPFVSALRRGIVWFLLYLVTMAIRERAAVIAGGISLQRIGLLLLATVATWLFWSASPYLLVRDGGRGWRSLLLAGLAGAAIDGIALPVVARFVVPLLLAGWEGFGPIGVAMTMMTWCGVIGFGWVVSACAGAVIWERHAPAELVIETQLDPTDTDEPQKEPRPT